MRNYTFILITCSLLITNQAYCQSKPNTILNNFKCNALSPLVEIWNHTGSNYIIGDWGNKKDTYSKSNGWNSTDFPYPKMFDLKLTIVNNPILYDHPSKVGDYQLSVNLKLRVGQSKDATYPLNSNVLESIQLIKDKLISDIDFKKGNQSIDHIDIWQKKIDFSYLYTKYQKQNLFINQLIFEIHLTSKSNCSCNYEYAFSMAEKEDP